jgi:hypothetical protein
MKENQMKAPTKPRSTEVKTKPVVLNVVAEAIQKSKYPQGRARSLQKGATPTDYRYAQAALIAILDLLDVEEDRVAVLAVAPALLGGIHHVRRFLERKASK